MKKLLLFTGLLCFFACQEKTKKFDINTDINPFFQEWNTPYGVPPFLYIKDEHYMQAFKKGMEENLQEINGIVNNTATPTFANTIEELERTGKLLSKVQRTFSNLAGSNTNPQLQELQRKLSPMLSAHYDKISLNQGLFLRVEKIWKDRETIEISSEQRKLLEDTRKQFVRSGALLNKDQKTQITNINSKISQLTTEFGQNLLAETNDFELIINKNQLDGLSKGTIAAASDAANKKLNQAETTEEKEKYKERSLQIAAEMKYVFSNIK